MSNLPIPFSAARPNQDGFGLVEVIIAMAIGMFGMLAIMQAFTVNERYKENTVGSTGAQTNASIALFNIERDVRMAGYAITHPAALGCSTVQYHFDGGYSNPPGGGSTVLPTLLMAPVVITQGAGTDPDTITTLASTSAYRFAPATLTAALAAADAELRVDDITGFAINDMLVLTQGGTCALMQLSNIVPATLRLKRESGAQAKFNPAAGGSLPAFASGAEIFNLGQLRSRTFAVAANNLTVSELQLQLGGSPPLVIVDEIVDLQAEYGVDDGSSGGAADDGIVDGYTTITPNTATGWQRVLSVRLGVLARGSFERPDAGGACSATPAAAQPTWAGGNLTVPDGLPSCYRFRAFETIIPIRNMIWRDK